MINTEEKYKINTRHALLLFLQLILIKLGLIVQVLVLIFIIMNNLSPYMLVSTIFMILAHIGIFVYSYFGYKKGRIFYFVTVGLFLLAVIVNIAIPFRDVTQRILLTFLFGSMVLFTTHQDNYKFTNIVLFIASLFALAFSIYSSIIANPNNLGDVSSNVFPEIVMYLSIFAPIVITGLFGVAYNARHAKELLIEGEQQ